MTLQTSGAISFQDLINEFDVPKPVSLSQMYAGAGYVPEANTGVPKSGAISLGNFYGATAAYVLDYNITADRFNFNSSTLLANSSWDGVLPVVLTVNIADGIVVSGNDTSIPAFVVNALPSGSQVFLNNNGFIIGMGGRGGNAHQAGGSGGIALTTLTNIVITNTGTIGGGGGGGGGGATSGSYTYAGASGGGGGQSGRVNSGGGSGSGRGKAGSQGSFDSAGAGGSDKAGAGGTWGAGGAAATAHGTAGTWGAGGAGGAAVVGNSLINWVSEGTIMGSRLN